MGRSHILAIVLKNLANLLALIFAQVQFLADLRSSDGNGALLLKTDLLISLVLRLGKDLFDLLFHLLVLWSATRTASLAAGSTRATLSRSAFTAWRSTLETALSATLATRRSALAALAPALSTLRRATLESTAARTTGSAWPTRTAHWHQLTELLLLLFGQLEFFLNAGVHEKSWTLKSATRTHSGAASHSTTWSLRWSEATALRTGLLAKG